MKSVVRLISLSQSCAGEHLQLYSTQLRDIYFELYVLQKVYMPE